MRLQRFFQSLLLSGCDPAGATRCGMVTAATQTTHSGHIQPSGNVWWSDASFPHNTLYSPENGNLGIRTQPTMLTPNTRHCAMGFGLFLGKIVLHRLSERFSVHKNRGPSAHGLVMDEAAWCSSPAQGQHRLSSPAPAQWADPWRPLQESFLLKKLVGQSGPRPPQWGPRAAGVGGL